MTAPLLLIRCPRFELWPHPVEVATALKQNDILFNVGPDRYLTAEPGPNVK